MWDFTSREVRFFAGETNAWQSYPYTFESNDMYISEVNDFFSCVVGGKNPLVNLEQAARVLKLVLAAKSASECRAAELPVGGLSQGEKGKIG